MILGLILLVGTVQAQNVSVFSRESEDLPRKYGIQITGGMANYAMSDINDHRVSGDHAVNQTDVTGSAGFGLGVLYRSHENFRWTVGYNAFGQDRTEAAWVDGQGLAGQNEYTVSGSELYFMGSYMLRFGERLHISLGAGPEIVFGKLDRVSSAATNVFDVRGKDFGFRFAGGIEFVITEGFAIYGEAGYRVAKIDRLIEEDLDGNESTMVWQTGSDRKMTMDFSGIFFGGGARIYFAPATDWFKL
jgi:hypothetical protein